jgi:hypothetical protein
LAGLGEGFLRRGCFGFVGVAPWIFPGWSDGKICSSINGYQEVMQERNQEIGIMGYEVDWFREFFLIVGRSSTY